MGNRRIVEKALEQRRRRRALVSATTTCCAPPTACVCPASAPSRRRWRRCATRGLDELVRERAHAGMPVFGSCLGMQLLFDSLRGARAARRASACWPARSSRRLDAGDAEAAAHRLERGALDAALAADRGPARPGDLLPRALVRAAPGRRRGRARPRRLRRRVRVGRRARPRLRRAVPPREVLARTASRCCATSRALCAPVAA